MDTSTTFPLVLVGNCGLLLFENVGWMLMMVDAFINVYKVNTNSGLIGIFLMSSTLFTGVILY
jgi:hypothetical protein